MMKAIRLLLISSLLVSLVGCNLISKKKSYDVKYPPELVPVDSKIKDKKYFEAHDQIDAYLNKSENLEYFGHAYFLKGFIYELQGETDKAIDFYRRAIKHTSKFNSIIEAKSLYNLSFTYERNNQFDNLMTVLTDLVQRPKYFRPLTARVETPARMGAALASLGQMEKAKKYHDSAAATYADMSRSNMFKPSRLAMTKALYYLGVVVYEAKDEKFDDLRDKLSWGQTHLLACAEASIGSWSRKAANRLLTSYDKMWSLIENYKVEDKSLDPQTRKKQKHYRQLQMASDFYDILRKVRPEEFPLTKVNRYSTIIVATSDKWLVKLENFAQGLDVGPEMIRDKKVKQRPLTKLYKEQMEIKKPKINKEIAKPLPPPIGVQISEEIQKEMAAEQSKNAAKLKAEMANEFKQKEDSLIKKERDNRSKIIPLPAKDPNL